MVASCCQQIGSALLEKSQKMSVTLNWYFIARKDRHGGIDNLEGSQIRGASDACNATEAFSKTSGSTMQIIRARSSAEMTAYMRFRNS